MESSEKSKESARQILENHITEKKLRKSSERFAILDYISTHNGHFTIDTLYNKLTEENFHVSRSTLYNTIELLLECNLIVKHHFKSDVAEYERSFNTKVHHHLVCTQCGSVREFTDVNIRRNIQTKIYKKFSMTHFSLVVYGICEDCERKKGQKNIEDRG